MEHERTPTLGPRVLLVDDDQELRRVARRYLEGASYQVLEAFDGRHALAIWERWRGEVDVLVTDLVMPALDGHSLAAGLRGLAPSLPVVLISGAPHLADSEPLAHPLRFLAKPFDRRELVQAVREVLAHDALAHDPLAHDPLAGGDGA